MNEYIPLEQCKNRFLYKVSSRNLIKGVFNAETNGFIGIREKFGDYFLFEEYHWDTGSPFGTVHPLEELKELLADISLEETLYIVDKKTGRKVDFDKSSEDKGWFFIDTKEKTNDIHPSYVKNEALFNWLKEN